MNLKHVNEQGICISTVNVPFMNWYGDYETAINLNGNVENGWRVIEGYDTKEEAIKGHEKYVNMTTDELKKVKIIG